MHSDRLSASERKNREGALSTTVTAVIPVRDRAHLLRRAIDSVLAQRGVEVDVLVVDDGSVDDPEAVVRSMGERRVRLVRRDSPGGGAAARNTGIDLARGAIVAFLDSDDVWLPDKLRRQLPYLRPGQPALALCGFLAVYPHCERLAVPGVLRGEPLPRLLDLSGGPLTASMMTLPTELAREIRFDDALPALQDLDFAIRIAARGGRISGPKDVLLHKGSDTPGRIYVRGNEIAARLLLLEKYRNALAQRPEAAARHHRALALAYYRSDQPTFGEQHLRAARALTGDWGTRLLVRTARRPAVVRRLAPAVSTLQGDVYHLVGQRLRDVVGRRSSG